MDSPALTETNGMVKPSLRAGSPVSAAEIGGIKIPKPQSNTYQKSAAVSTAAVKDEVGVLGHNSFRSDVYRVTEGYVA